MNERNDIARAAAADGILDHPLMAESLSHWEAEITKAWKNSNPSDADGHQRLRNLLEAHRMFVAYLQQTIATGRLIKPLPSRMDKAKRVIGLR